MTRTADVEGARLTVPAGWWIWKYDDSAFHRQFQYFAGGSKAMDAIALSIRPALLTTSSHLGTHSRLAPGTLEGVQVLS